MKLSRTFYLTLAVGVLLLGLSLGAVFLGGCTVRLETKAAAAPPCCTPCTPIATPTVPAPTPVKTPTSAPSPQATATPTRPAPAPSPSPTVIPIVAPFQTTGGRAVVRIDLTGFRIADPAPNGDVLDYYSGASLFWRQPPSGNVKPDTPALELSIRGTSQEQCTASPCGNTSLGLVARWSCSVRHDAGEPDEKKHVGEGINYRYRLPIGPDKVFDVVVEWGPDARKVRVSTAWGSWTARRGVNVPGFGVFIAGIPNPPKGSGWAREPWSLQGHGGAATLVSWTKVEPIASLTTCP